MVGDIRIFKWCLQELIPVPVSVCDSRSVLLLMSPSSLWQEFSSDLDCLAKQDHFVAGVG